MHGSLALSTSTETVERRQLVGAHAVKARIVEGRRARVAGDLGAQVRLGRLQGTDAAAQLAVLLQRDEAGGAAREEGVARRRRQRARQDDSSRTQARA